jgi:transposase InsO family protein
MARGFVYLTAVVDWFSRRVLAWRVSISMEVDFCLDALDEVLARHGLPEIFNTDSKNDGVGSFRRSRACQSLITVPICREWQNKVV